MGAENRNRGKHHSLDAVPDSAAVELFLHEVSIADQFCTTLNCQTVL